MQRTWLSQRWLTILTSLFVVICSFAYGVVQGLSKQLPPAFASIAPDADHADDGIFNTALHLPEEVHPVSMGSDMQINGRAADLVSFTSARSVPSLLAEQVAYWEQLGFVAGGVAGKRRGVAVAYDNATGKRYSISAWVVPPAMRGMVSSGRPVQGFIGMADEHNGTPGALLPGVPLMPGGRAGALFSSNDVGGRSYTSVYTVPRSVVGAMEYYRTEMTNAGWKLRTGQHDPENDEFGSLVFEKRGEELTLLFVLKPAAELTMFEESVIPSLERQN